MAFYTTQLDAPKADRGFFGRLMDRMAAAIEAQNQHLSRRDRIEALEAKTDAELAQMGIKRDQIAYHVYHDLFYA